MFRVEWARTPLEQVAAELRPQIRQAVTDIDEQLSRNPLDCGESREENRRVVFAPPLVVNYEINERLRLVMFDVLLKL